MYYLSTYQNFTLSGISTTSLNIIVIGVAVGLVAAVIISTIYKLNGYRAVKALLDKNAFDIDAAVSIDEMGLKKGKRYIMHALARNDKPLRKLIYAVDDENTEYKKPSALSVLWHTKFIGTPVPKKLDVKKAKFYIPAEKKDAAELRFPKVHRPVFTIVLSIVGTLLLAWFILKAVPELLTMLDNLITQFTPESNIY